MDAEQTPGKQPQRYRWFRFGLATFLFLSLCIGALIAGYQSGYRRGYDSGAAQRYDDSQVVEVYSTVSIIWPDLPAEERTQSVDRLMNLVRTTIATEIWFEGAGNEIRDFPDNQSIVVTAPGSVHREIKGLFVQLERLSNRGGAEQLLPVLQAMAAQGKSEDSPLPITAPKNSQLAQAWLERYFRLTADGISRQWGSPKFLGACTDSRFPKWSLDQQLATWPRGDGVAYLALRYFDDGQLHVVAGWRENS